MLSCERIVVVREFLDKPILSEYEFGWMSGILFGIRCHKVSLHPLVNVDQPNLQDVGNDVVAVMLLYIFKLNIDKRILFHGQSFVTWREDCIGIVKGHGLDQYFGMPRVRFEEDSLFGQPDDPIEYADLLIEVLVLTYARPDFDLKSLLEFGLVPIETEFVTNTHEVVAMNHQGEFLCDVLEAARIGDASDESQAG